MDGQALTATGTPRAERVIRLTDSPYAKWSVYGLMAFPIVDFALRLNGIHPLGVVWDKIVLLILAIYAGGRFMGGVRPVWFTWQKFALWFIVLTAGLMFAGMGDPLVAVQGFRNDIYYMLYAFLIPFVVGSDDVPKLLHLGALVGTLIAVHGVYQFVTRAPIPGDFVDATEHVRTRVYSVLMSPNELGAYMALMTPLLAGLALYETHKFRRFLYWFGTACAAATLLFTLTRAAWVSLALAVFIMAVLFERRLLIFLILFAVVGYFLPPIHHRIAELVSPVYWMKSVNEGGRIARWLTAFDKMASNPLLGVGVGHYGGAVAAQYHSGTYSDNYYAKTLGETGLVGLILYVSMHLALVRGLFQYAVGSATGRARFALIGGVTGLIAMLIHNTMENVFEYPANAVAYFTYATLFLIWGLGLSGKEGAHDEK